MKRTAFLSFIIASALVTAPMQAHDQGAGPSNMPEHLEQSAPLGNGFIRTYVRVDKVKDPATNLKKPLELGVEVSEAAMKSLPGEGTSFVLDFPRQARHMPFQFMMLDWNPHGHEPAGIYDKPHFDFHFYIQDLEDVMQILPGPCFGLACDVYDKARKPLPEQYLPQGYIDVGSVVPYMGNHLIDPTSPEFQGQPFTRTWLYGVYDGEVTFYEPMITRESLVSQPNQCVTLKLPQQYAQSGYYPTRSCTQFNRKERVYRVSLQDFVYRSAPGRF